MIRSTAQTETTSIQHNESHETAQKTARAFCRSVSDVSEVSAQQGLRKFASAHCAEKKKESVYLPYPSAGLTYSVSMTLLEKAALAVGCPIGEERPAQSISEAQEDYSKMTSEGSAYLAIWQPFHSGLIIGSADNNHESAYKGSSDFVNWRYAPNVVREENKFSELFDLEQKPTDGIDVPYTKECHIHGKPDIIRFNGLDTEKMRDMWSHILRSEGHQSLSNDCYKVTSRVLKSGLPKDDQVRLGQPRCGLWSKYNVQVLANRICYLRQTDTLPEANDPIIPQGVKESVISLLSADDTSEQGSTTQMTPSAFAYMSYMA